MRKSFIQEKKNKNNEAEFSIERILSISSKFKLHNQSTFIAGSRYG